MTGAISSKVPITSRLGMVMFSGGGTGYTDLTAQADTFTVGANNGIATTATVTIGTAAAASLDLTGFSQSLVGVVKGGFAGTFGNSSTTADSTLTLTGTSTFAGTSVDLIGSGTRKESSAKSDGGTSTLSGANTYTGGTVISTGSLRGVTRPGRRPPAPARSRSAAAASAAATRPPPRRSPQQSRPYPASSPAT